MANMNPKVENLIKNCDRTPNERSEIAKRAGMKSGEIRREKRKMREILEILLSQDIKQSGELQSTKEAIMVQVIKKALAGDLKAVEFIQNTILEKPTEKLFMSFEPKNKSEVRNIIDEILAEHEN